MDDNYVTDFRDYCRGKDIPEELIQYVVKEDENGCGRYLSTVFVDMDDLRDQLRGSGFGDTEVDARNAAARVALSKCGNYRTPTAPSTAPTVRTSADKNQISYLNELSANKRLPNDYSTPNYKTTGPTGVDHSLEFTCECMMSVDGVRLTATGRGPNKKKAKKHSAAAMIEEIRKHNNGNNSAASDSQHPQQQVVTNRSVDNIKDFVRTVVQNADLKSQLGDIFMDSGLGYREKLDRMLVALGCRRDCDQSWDGQQCLTSLMVTVDQLDTPWFTTAADSDRGVADSLAKAVRKAVSIIKVMVTDTDDD